MSVPGLGLQAVGPFLGRQSVLLRLHGTGPGLTRVVHSRVLARTGRANDEAHLDQAFLTNGARGTPGSDDDRRTLEPTPAFATVSPRPRAERSRVRRSACRGQT